MFVVWIAVQQWSPIEIVEGGKQIDRASERTEHTSICKVGIQTPGPREAYIKAAPVRRSQRYTSTTPARGQHRQGSYHHKR